MDEKITVKRTPTGTVVTLREAFQGDRHPRAHHADGSPLPAGDAHQDDRLDHPRVHVTTKSGWCMARQHGGSCRWARCTCICHSDTTQKPAQIPWAPRKKDA